jgi:hypothetical protein
MNEELLALYTADREERIDQPRMGTPEYTAMRERDRQRRLRAAAILSTQPSLSQCWLCRRQHCEREGCEGRSPSRSRLSDLELAKQADEPPPLSRLVGYWQRRDQQLVDFGRQ